MSYDLKTPRVPRLVGRALRAACETLESNRVGAALQRGLVWGVGLDTLGSSHVTGVPSLAPELPVHEDAMATEGTLTSRLPQLQALAETGTHKGPGGAPTIADYARAYRDGSRTPLDVAERFLSFVEEDKRAKNGPLGAVFVSVDAEDLLAQAKASAARWARGEPLSVLDGVPVPVKDEMDQLGHPTTAGSLVLDQHHRATRDAVVVARLRQAGALLVGKTNMQELGAGATGLNVPRGTPRNPWNPEHHTGGSSSGSATAVALGLAPLAVGCDGGGSIRIPASLCGLVGLKGSYGRMSSGGLVPLSPSLQHSGPITGTVADCAVGYAVMAGRDPGDVFSLPQPPVDVGGLLDGLATASMTGVRLGIYRPWFDDADPGVRATCHNVLDLLRQAGAVLVDVTVPQLELARVAHLAIVASESRLFLEEYGAKRDQLSFDVRLGFAIGRAIEARHVQQAQRHRRALGRAWHAMLHGIDALVTPTTPVTAPPIRPDALLMGEADSALLGALMRFTSHSNLIGVPGLSVPVGFSSGLPVGLQLLGKAWDEGRLLQIGAAVETVTAPQRSRRPVNSLYLLS
jgi:Asp-tRNA(Asn)/Glu-tRNA(Gln) amidotransferase A subunit family amidase